MNDFVGNDAAYRNYDESECYRFVIFNITMLNGLTLSVLITYVAVFSFFICPSKKNHLQEK